MQENYQLALQLLIVGMFSVFFILGIVVALGKVLVLTVNKYSTEVKSAGTPKTRSLDNKKIAVIASTVNLITQGKGVISSVKKL